MAPIFLTLIVLSKDKSNDFKEEHWENVAFISLTLIVLNEDKSIDFKEEHPKNIKQVLVNNLLNLNITLISPFSLFLYLQSNFIFLLFIYISILFSFSILFFPSIYLFLSSSDQRFVLYL